MDDYHKRINEEMKKLYQSRRTILSDMIRQWIVKDIETLSMPPGKMLFSQIERQLKYIVIPSVQENAMKDWTLVFESMEPLLLQAREEYLHRWPLMFEALNLHKCRQELFEQIFQRDSHVDKYQFIERLSKIPENILRELSAVLGTPEGQHPLFSFVHNVEIYLGIHCMSVFDQLFH